MQICCDIKVHFLKKLNEAVFLYVHQRSAPGRPGLDSGTKFHVLGSLAGSGQDPGGIWEGSERGPSRIWAGSGHIIYFPGPGLKLCWPGVGAWLDYIARDLKNPGYPGRSAYLNYISRNMRC